MVPINYYLNNNFKAILIIHNMIKLIVRHYFCAVGRETTFLS